ncbi:MAG: hypothetical protein ACRD82_00490, partial [Blastocatellia bacterium]
IHGVVTDGDAWQFGRLTHDKFIKHPTPYGTGDLATLFGALDFVMTELKQALAKHPLPKKPPALNGHRRTAGKGGRR